MYIYIYITSEITLNMIYNIYTVVISNNPYTQWYIYRHLDGAQDLFRDISKTCGSNKANCPPLIAHLIQV